MKRIIPHLWFDQTAGEAADFYKDVFEVVEVHKKVVIEETPSGKAELIGLKIHDLELMMISAGPAFKINPALSFLVACEDEAEVRKLHFAFTAEGTELMPLNTYPFSSCYAWVVDKFGVSWQLMAMDDRVVHQKVTPTIMFVGEQVGKCEEAVHFYTTLFEDSAVYGVDYYGEEALPNQANYVKHIAFKLNNQWFAAMDSAYEHGFSLNEAMSLIVGCETQEEINYYWSQLSAKPESEACGWLKDSYGLSWQVTPVQLQDLMSQSSPEQFKRMTQAMFKMKKLDIAQLEAAFYGEN